MKAIAVDSIFCRVLQFVLKFLSQRSPASESCDQCGKAVSLRHIVLHDGVFHCERCARDARGSSSV